MATKAGVWGIDLGQCALKAIRLEMIDGQVTATAFDYIEHPKILSQPDADPDQLTREALEQFLSRNQLKGDQVAISVPGQSGLARFVKLPPVEEKKIADIVRFEAKQQIPFPLEEVVWDFQKVGQGIVTDGFALETEIGLFAMKRDMINRFLQHFRDVHVEIHLVQMAPLGLCNFVTYDLLGQDPKPVGGDEDEGEKKPCVVALDIGTDSSNLVITDGAKIIWQRPIPLGGNHFTRALTKDLKLTFAKAEHVKRNAVKSPDIKKILGALKPVLNDFVGEVQRSLGYFTNTHRDAQIAYMIGLGNAFRLPGLQKYMQEKLQLDVRKLGKMERLDGDAVVNAPQFTENILSFAVAYGLALQGLNRTQLQTNLLPQEIRTERLVRAKKPWAVAAAAALLLAVAGLTFGRSLEQKAVSNPDIAKAVDAAKKAVDKKSGIEQAYKTQLDKIKESDDAVVRISAGADERFNWRLLMQYINSSLPRPNGEKVPARTRDNTEAHKKYVTPDALKANQMVVEKRFAKTTPVTTVFVKTNQDQDGFIKKNLVQLNIEGIAQLYSDDLGPYFTKLVADSNRLLGMQREEQGMFDTVKKTVKEEAKDKLPKKGWVVEIRGYTYHDHGESLVIDTIMENLGYPEGVGNVMPEEMKKQIKAQIGFLVLYKWKKVENPVPGQFEIIKTSTLRSMISGGTGDLKMGPGIGMPAAAPPGPQGPMDAMNPPGGDSGGGGKSTRDSWKPLGEIASVALGAGSGGGMGFPGGGGDVMKMPGSAMPMPTPGGPGMMPPGMKGPATATTNRQPRTEFIILFVWKEPTGEAAPAEDAAKKD